MKAPDKIYVAMALIRTRYGKEWSTKPYISRRNTEYLRKDALLEWANRLIEKWEEPPMSNHSPGCVFMLEQVIKKIESL